MSSISALFTSGDVQLRVPAFFVGLILFIVLTSLVIGVWQLKFLKVSRRVIEDLLREFNAKVGSGSERYAGSRPPEPATWDSAWRDSFQRKVKTCTSKGAVRILREVERIMIAPGGGLPFNGGERCSHLAAMVESWWTSAFLRFSVGVVLMLGLAGTFVAFGELVSESGVGEAVMSDGETASVLRLEESIPKIVGHLNLAFVASIFGVLGSVVLQFLNTVFVQPNRARFYGVVERFFWLSPAERSPFEVEDEVEEENGEVSSTTGNQALREVFEAISGSLAQAVGSISGVSDLLAAAEKSTPKKLGVTIGELRDVVSALPERFETLVEAAGQTRRSVDEISTKASSAIDLAIGRFDQRQGEALAQMAAYKNDLLTKIEENDTRLRNEFSAKVNDVVANFVNVRSSWEESAGRLIEAIGKDRETYLGEVQKERELSAKTVVAAGEAAMKALSETYQNQVGEWKAIAELARGHRDAITESLKLFSDGRREILDDLALLHGKAGAVLETGNAAAQSLEVALDGLGGRLAAVDATMVGVQSSVQSTGAEVARTGESVRATVERAAADLERRLSGFAGKVEGLAICVERLETRLRLRSAFHWKEVKAAIDKLAFWKRNV